MNIYLDRQTKYLRFSSINNNTDESKELGLRLCYAYYAMSGASSLNSLYKYKHVLEGIAKHCTKLKDMSRFAPKI